MSKTVRSLMSPGTRLRFKHGKVNVQSHKSARRENTPKSGKSYNIGTRIKL